MGARVRDQCERDVLVLSRRRARHGRARLRADRQRGLDRRQGGEPACRRILRFEGRGDRVHEVDRQGSRGHGRPRQLHCAGGDRHADPRGALGAACRLHGRAHPARPAGSSRRGRRADLLARERGDVLLHGRLLRHLRRPGCVLMAKLARSAGGRSGWLVDGRIQPVDDPLAALEVGGPAAGGRQPPDGLALPFDPPEVWCAGVTYERSRRARVEETQVQDVYSLVYDADRPELFLKDAGCRRTVGPGEPIGVRGESTWTVPEPELALVLGRDGRIVGATAGNDVTSRDIEAVNPLYLPQAKIFAAACALGPVVLTPDEWPDVFVIRCRILAADGALLWEGETSTAQMRRSFDDLVAWLARDNPIPAGTVLLTGTGLVPPDDVALAPGQRVEVSVSGIGTLVNPVGAAADLLRREGNV